MKIHDKIYIIPSGTPAVRYDPAARGSGWEGFVTTKTVTYDETDRMFEDIPDHYFRFQLPNAAHPYTMIQVPVERATVLS